MSSRKWKMIQIYQCPCGYEFDPEKGDTKTGWGPGTPFEKLPEAGTCPHCQRARVHFREKKYSVAVEE